MVNRVKVASLLMLPAAFAGLVLTAAPAATATATATAAAHLDKVGTTLLQTHGIRLRTTTGKRVFAAVVVDRFSWHVHPADTDVQVLVGKGHEGHNWVSGRLPRRDFSFDLHTGRGRLVAGRAALDRFGRIDLRLTQRAPSTLRTCGAGVAERTTPVRVRGTFRFRTHTSGARRPWGSLGSRTRVMRFTGRNDIVTQYGNPADACFEPPSCPATGDMGWTGPGGRHGSLTAGSFVTNGQRHGFLDGSEAHRVHGSDIERLDFVFRPFAPPHVVTSPAGKSVAALSNGRRGTRGSATLKSIGAATTRQRSCDGVMVSERSWQASYTNGTTPLQLREDIGGGFIQRNSGHGATIVVTSAGTQPATPRALRPVRAGPLATQQHVIRRTSLAQWRAAR